MSSREIEREQEYLSMLYERVDELRAEAARRLSGVLTENGGTAQARVERDSTFAGLSDRVARFDAAENGLCFGRIDLRDGGHHYIGRIGLHGDGDGDPLLLDWRAPAARPFYVATSAAPEGVRRRRHIATRRRRVIGLDDEVLSGDADGSDLIGEAALLAALNAGRTGRMGDIVATLQAEQDEIIRSDHKGILVVQGGPGTGKTAVALHRAAYLLYTHRRVAARGVLVVGPNATFLAYIGQVLPGLGETSVLLSTVGELFPGVTAERSEAPEAAVIKGRAAMADVLAAAVRDRQGNGPTEFEFDGDVLRIDPEALARAVADARATRLPHNQARPYFLRGLVTELARQAAENTQRLADRLEEELAEVLDPAELAALREQPDDVQVAPDLVSAEDVADLRRRLWQDTEVRAALDELWPELTPQGLLADLYADPERLASAAADLPAGERALLARTPGGWSTADVPLLDEAAELLGEDDRAERAAAARAERERVAYAHGVLDHITGGEGAGRLSAAGGMSAADLLTAEDLAERHQEEDHRTLAERAAADRTWTFGHVIVDEAQELSEMAWRLLMRRCPARSMTVVGDVAQTGDPAGTSSWRRALEPHVGDRWRLRVLSVNYRTPAEIMAAASGVLAELHPELDPPRSVRETGVPPWRRSVASLPEALAEHAARELERLDDGRLAVIVPQARAAELAAAIPAAAAGPDPDLTSRVVVLGVRQAKGLEFDSVLIADPAAILSGSARGLNDLYVALTRATQRLGILHQGEPPELITPVAESNA